MDTPINLWHSRFAKFCVFALLVLIALGALVTTYDAGMAVATWPTIHGDLNPPGWSEIMVVRLEHSHRLTAMGVGVFVGILCAMVWRNIWALGVAAGVSGLSFGLAKAMSIEGNLAMQLRIWPAAVAFVVFLLIQHRRRGEKTTRHHRLALILFFCVCVQAVMGGYRVTIETDGNKAVKAAEELVAKAATAPAEEAVRLRQEADILGTEAQALYPLATNFRVLHGLFAQFTLLLLVIFAANLSPVTARLAATRPLEGGPKLAGMALSAIILYFMQLACGAYLRHRNLGMTLNTWPGGWPEIWSMPVTIHFLHSRVFPFLMAGHIISMAFACSVRARGLPRLTRVGWTLVALLVVQICLGVLVIWKGGRYAAPHGTNTHVVNGALILSTAALLFVRARAVSPRPTV